MAKRDTKLTQTHSIEEAEALHKSKQSDERAKQAEGSLPLVCPTYLPAVMFRLVSGKILAARGVRLPCPYR